MVFGRFSVLCLILFAFTGSISWAESPLSGSTGARPLALGGAYVGLSNDSYGLFVNPSGLAGIRSLHILSMYYAQPEANSRFASLGVAIPAFLGGMVGVGYRNISISGVNVSAEVLSFGDQELLLSYARILNDKFSLGAEGKYMLRGFSKVISGFEGANGSGSSFSLSCKYVFRPWLGIGATYQDLNGKITYLDKSVDKLRSTVTVGTAFNLLGKEAYLKNKDQEVLVNLDVSRTEKESNLFHLGIEWWPVREIALRMGLDQSPKTVSENYTNITAGIGMKYLGINFDYALYRQGDVSGSISNYFSISYAGKEEPLPIEASPEAEKKIKPELLHFSDVPSGHWAQKEIEALTTLGVLNYDSDGNYNPERPVTRAETAVVLVRAKGIPLPKEKQQVFTDVPTNFWASDHIQAIWENHLTLGFPDGSFLPRKATSRAEAAIFISRFENLTLSQILEKPYLDLNDNFWGIKEVLAAKAGGMFDYIKDNNFEPSQGITRAELAALLYKTDFAKKKRSAVGLD